MSCDRPPLSSRMKRGACGSSVKSESWKFASTPPAALQLRPVLAQEHWHLRTRDAHRSAEHPSPPPAIPAGCNVPFCQTQSPICAGAAAFAFSGDDFAIRLQRRLQRQRQRCLSDRDFFLCPARCARARQVLVTMARDLSTPVAARASHRSSASPLIEDGIVMRGGERAAFGQRIRTTSAAPSPPNTSMARPRAISDRSSAE